MTRTHTLTLALALAATLGGCGLSDPYADEPVTPPGIEDTDRDTAAPAAEDHLTEPDEATGVTTPATIAGDTRGAERVARHFAATSLTYSPDTYVTQQRSLRARATGAMASELRPPVPDEDTAASLKASNLTSRATVLVSDVATATDTTAEVIVLLKVYTGRGGNRSTTPSYQPYRVKLSKDKGAWRVHAMDAP